jgi:hypothetical protein
MPHWVMAAVFAPLGGLAIWSLLNDLKTGEARDDIWRFAADANPAGYAIIVVSKVLIVILCAAETLYGLGLIPEPFRLLKVSLGMT